MKKNAIIRIVLYVVLILLLGGLLIAALSGFGPGPVIHTSAPADAQEHSEVRFPADASFTDFDIEWASGTIRFVLSDTDSLTVTETGGEELPMVTYVDEDTLHIQFSRSFSAFRRAQKDLTVSVPAGWPVGDISIDSADSDVEIEGLEFRELELDGASNRAVLTGCIADEISLDGASNRLEFEGILRSQLESDGASNHCTLRLQEQIAEIDLDGVSSSLELYMPDHNFTVDSDGLSINIESDFPFTRSGDLCTYLGAPDPTVTRISVDGVSSRIQIYRAS